MVRRNFDEREFLPYTFGIPRMVYSVAKGTTLRGINWTWDIAV
jgi:hypothetical protein